MGTEKVMLFSHDAHPLMVSGAEKALLMFGFACQRLGWKVGWVSPKTGLSCERAGQLGMETHVVPFPLLWSLIHDPQRLAEELANMQQAGQKSGLDRWLAEHSSDWIVSNTAINGLPPLLAWKRKIPVWWYIHEVLPQQDATKQLVSAMHAYSNLVLVPSEDVKASILRQNRHLSPLLQHLPYGVEFPSDSAILRNRRTIRQQNGWTDQHTVVGWFGSVYPGKGLLDVIQSVSSLRQKVTRIVVAAAGMVVDPAYFKLCREAASRHPSFEFRYLGVLSRIGDILPAVDLVAVPSLVEEALPNVALEAMAFGKCVAAYASGGLKRIVVDGQTGVLVGKGDIAALGAAIHELVKDPAKREKMGRNGREQAVREHHISLFCERVERLLIQQWQHGNH